MGMFLISNLKFFFFYEIQTKNHSDLKNIALNNTCFWINMQFDSFGQPCVGGAVALVLFMTAFITNAGWPNESWLTKPMLDEPKSN